MMFKVKLKDGGAMWKKLVECLKDVVTDVSFVIDGDGIRMEAMDVARVCLINLTLSANGFTSYKVDAQGPTVVVLPLANLSKIFRFADNDAQVTLMSDQYDTSYVKFVFEMNNGTRCDFRVATMAHDGTYSKYEVPNVKYSASVEMPSADFAKTCRDLASISETVHAYVDAEGFTLKADGDIGVARVAFKKGDDVTISRSDEVELDLGVRHLVALSKAGTLSDKVSLSFQNDYPLRAVFRLGDGMGTLSYYLAPRIIDSDDE